MISMHDNESGKIIKSKTKVLQKQPFYKSMSTTIPAF